ncbi:MAG: L-serine ammonia-lyase, iron-sulfur-dependent, subunit alpha [Cyanobacteria bacterium P01_H01_bin.74]
MTGFDSFKALLAYCAENNVPVYQAALDYETARSDYTESQVLEKMETILHQMRLTVQEGIDSETLSLSGLSGGDAKRVLAFSAANPDRSFLSALEINMIAFGLATLEENSRMKKIVACPTAGGSGSVPAALLAVELEKNLSPEITVRGLLTASLIGEITARRLFLSGSAAGCQAEVGVASGMAAAGLAEMMAGSPQQVVNAAAISMQNLMGLVCDPVAGLVEVPCVLRNGLSGVQAGAAATMALADVRSFIPLDEVVEAMAAVGKLMHPSLKETAAGGLAKTPTAVSFTEKFLKKATVQKV